MTYNFTNILIIKPSAIGDIVMALPALSALRKAFGDAKITWLVRCEYAPLLRNHPDLNELILFDRKLLGKWWYSPQSFRALLALMRQLRSEHFDAVIDFQGLFRTGLFGLLSGAKHRFGQGGAREFASLFYNHKVCHDLTCVHVADFYLKLVESAAGRPAQGEFAVPHDENAEDSIRRLLGEKQAADNYIVLVPGASNRRKRWPAENFAALADKIHSQFGASILTTGSKSEQKVTTAVKAAATTPVIDLAGQTSLPELIALLRNARLVVSNDSGPGHIAGALGVPLVMLFGPTNPARLCAYRRPETVVTADPNFDPLEIDNFEPRHDIRNISIDDVHKKVIEQLQIESLKSSNAG
jgi:heptosyltransferase-1